jgi:hypothetical protein
LNVIGTRTPPRVRWIVAGGDLAVVEAAVD